MARYVDADTLKEVINYYYSHTGEPKTTVEHYAYGVVLKEIDRTPTADVVEVVRCKGCLYSHFNSSSLRYSCHREWNRRHVEEDDFCNYGKPQKRSDVE